MLDKGIAVRCSGWSATALAKIRVSVQQRILVSRDSSLATEKAVVWSRCTVTHDCGV